MPAVPTALGSASELRVVVRLALPAVASSLLQTLVFVVDRVVLGHFSEDALAAMQTSGPLIWTLHSLFGAFAVGTVAVVGRAVGAGASRDATGATRGSIALALVLGLAVAAGASALLDPMLDAFGGHDPAVRAISASYLRVMLPAMPAFFVGLAAISALQAAGDTRTPLAIGVVSNCVNVAGNLVLVFGRWGLPALGARGSAWSSVAAAVLEAALGLWALGRVGAPVALRGGNVLDARRGARRVVAVAWGAWGERAIYHTGYLLYVAFVVALGRGASAANQAAISVESIAFLTADGFAIAAGALVAQSLGAGEIARARRIGWIAAGACAVVLGACGLLFGAMPAALVRIFRDDPAMVTMGASALRVAAFAQVPMAISVVLAQAMRGAGATREALALAFLGGLAVRLGATYVFVTRLGLGLAGVWLGSTVDWWVRAVLYAMRWRAAGWARSRV